MLVYNDFKYIFCIYRRVLVNTLSTAGTGTHLLYKRDRLASKAVILRFDKAGKS